MDVDEARVRRYADAIYGEAAVMTARRTVAARAVIAVADEEQAELRLTLQRVRANWEQDCANFELVERRAEAAEAELVAFKAALREAGIEHPLTAQGVEDLSAQAEGRLEELVVAEAELADAQKRLAAVKALHVRTSTDPAQRLVP